MILSKVDEDQEHEEIKEIIGHIESQGKYLDKK